MKRAALTVLAAVATVLAGCSDMTPLKASTPPPATAPARPAESAAPRPLVANEGEHEGQTAVDQALAWAQKYSEAAQKVVQLTQENRDLSDKCQRLQDQITKQQAELTKAQNDVREANTMLVEMRQELEKWKANVLGFRQEMREAQQVQFTALSRIIRLLGGEALPSPAAAASAPATAATTPVPATYPVAAPTSRPTSQEAAPKEPASAPSR